MNAIQQLEFALERYKEFLLRCIGECESSSFAIRWKLQCGSSKLMASHFVSPIRIAAQRSGSPGRRELSR